MGMAQCEKRNAKGVRCGLAPDHPLGVKCQFLTDVTKPLDRLEFPTSRVFEYARQVARQSGCTCYWDPYNLHCDVKEDCPLHGEKKPECKKQVTAYRPPPDHYSTGTGIDPWAVWDAFDLDRYTANAVKYLLRAGKKDIAPRLDDLKKARDYINKAIEREELKGG